MAKPARHTIDIYGAVLHIAATRKQWQAIDLPDLEKINSSGLSQLTVWEPKRGLNVPHLSVYVDTRGIEAPSLVNLITHEAAHAAGMLLDHLEETYDGNSEALAYLAGWIAEQVWRHVKG